MRSNTMKTCAVGAMLFGGTLGSASTAQAELVFTNEGVNPTTNYAYESESVNFGNKSFSATSATVGGMNVAWSATTASGFSTTVTSSGFFDVTTGRTFTVTGSQTVTFSWSGSRSITFGIVTGPTSTDPVLGLGAGWFTSGGFSETNAAAGSVTVNLAAGNYWITSGLDGSGTSGGPSSFSFVVPAPGAAALVGVAGLMGRRRRN